MAGSICFTQGHLPANLVLVDLVQHAVGQAYGAFRRIRGIPVAAVEQLIRVMFSGISRPGDHVFLSIHRENICIDRNGMCARKGHAAIDFHRDVVDLIVQVHRRAKYAGLAVDFLPLGTLLRRPVTKDISCDLRTHGISPFIISITVSLLRLFRHRVIFPVYHRLIPGEGVFIMRPGERDPARLSIFGDVEHFRFFEERPFLSVYSRRIIYFCRIVQIYEQVLIPLPWHDPVKLAVQPYDLVRTRYLGGSYHFHLFQNVLFRAGGGHDFLVYRKERSVDLHVFFSGGVRLADTCHRPDSVGIPDNIMVVACLFNYIELIVQYYGRGVVTVDVGVNKFRPGRIGRIYGDIVDPAIIQEDRIARRVCFKKFGIIAPSEVRGIHRFVARSHVDTISLAQMTGEHVFPFYRKPPVYRYHLDHLDEGYAFYLIVVVVVYGPFIPRAIDHYTHILVELHRHVSSRFLVVRVRIRVIRDIEPVRIVVILCLGVVGPDEDVIMNVDIVGVLRRHRVQVLGGNADSRLSAVLRYDLAVPGFPITTRFGDRIITFVLHVIPFPVLAPAFDRGGIGVRDRAAFDLDRLGRFSDLYQHEVRVEFVTHETVFKVIGGKVDDVVNLAVDVKAPVAADLVRIGIGYEIAVFIVDLVIIFLVALMLGLAPQRVGGMHGGIHSIRRLEKIVHNRGSAVIGYVVFSRSVVVFFPEDQDVLAGCRERISEDPVPVLPDHKTFAEGTGFVRVVQAVQDLFGSVYF